MIREAGFTDIKKIARMCENIRGRSRYAGLCPPLDPKLTKLVLVDAIMASDKGKAVVLVSEIDGALNGMFVGTMNRLYEISDVRLATCLMWHVEEGVSAITSLRLARGFIEWAEQADGPLIIRLGLTDAIYEPESAARSLEKLEGFRRCGLIMEKERA